MKRLLLLSTALISISAAVQPAKATNYDTTYTFTGAELIDGGTITGSATYAFNGMWTWNILVNSSVPGYSYNFTNQANEFEYDDTNGAFYNGELEFSTSDYAHQLILFDVNSTHDGVQTFVPGAGESIDLTYSPTSSPSYVYAGGGERLSAGELTATQTPVNATPTPPKIDTAQGYYTTSQLTANSVLPEFNGGTLRVDTQNAYTLQNLTVDSAGGTVDTYGNHLSFIDGIVSGAGGLEFKDSTHAINDGAGALAFFADIGIYQGGTQVDKGATLGLSNNIVSGTLPQGTAVTLNGTLQLGGTAQTIASLAGTEATAQLDLGYAPGSTGLTITGTSTTSYAGTIVGYNPLLLNGGRLTLTGVNTYSGPTIITAGTLALSGAGSISNTSVLDIYQGATFDISAANGNRSVGSLAGSGAIVLGNNNLSTTSELNSTYSGSITSTGTLSTSGVATQTLDGVSTFSNTSVSSGNLEIGDASNPGATLNSPVTVTGGGMLSGHGTINGNVTNGGTVRPGGSIGALSVNGNYTQGAGATLAIELSPTASSKLAVSGTASLNGTLAVMADAGRYIRGTDYQIVSAGGGVSGGFATVTESGQVVPFNVLYSPNAVDLTVLANSPSTVTFAMGAVTPNEANALGAIESILPAASAGAFATGLTNLGLSTGSGSPRLAGVLGELRADLASVDLANLTSFDNFLVERMDRRQGLTSTMEVNTGLPGTFAPGDMQLAQNGATDMPLFGNMFGPNGALEDDQPSFWVHGYGVLGQLGGETGYAEAQYRTGGIVGGADLKVADGTLLGAAVAYEHTDLNLSGDTDENTIDTYRISLYGSSKLDPIGIPLTLDAALGYAFNDYHDSDFLPLPGSGFAQTSRHDGNELTAEAGLSQDVHIAQSLVPGALTVIPRVGVEYDDIQQNAYAAAGAPAGGLNLAANGSTLDALRGTIGARADIKLTTDNGTVVTPELRATYLHDFMDTNVTLTEAFAGAPTAGFRVSGVHPGREAALVGTGVTVGFSQNISATIGYEAAVRQHELDHTVQVGVKYKW